jgi:DNA-directed RNA polymerase subunit RPC12/RpoP
MSKYKCIDCGQEVLKANSINDVYVCFDCIQAYEQAKEDAFRDMVSPNVQAILDTGFAEGLNE